MAIYIILTVAVYYRQTANGKTLKIGVGNELDTNSN